MQSEYPNGILNRSFHSGAYAYNQRLVLDTIRTVKLLGWERAQSVKLEGARKEELECARNAIMMQIWIGCIK